MKTIIFFLAFFAGTFQACQKKALPTITTRTTEPAKPVTAFIDVKPDLAIGKIVFTNRCSRCHALPEPIQYTANRWESILKIMTPRARMDKQQEIHVTAYIKTNSTK